MLTEDVERAIFDLFDTLEPGTYVSREGKKFRKPTPMDWVVPRVTEIERLATSAGGQTEETWTIEVSCFVRNQIKGRTFGDLSRLVDTVRAVCDGEYPAADTVVDDGGSPSPQQVGVIRWGPVDEERLWGQAEAVIDSEEVQGVDVAILTATATVCGV